MNDYTLPLSALYQILVVCNDFSLLHPPISDPIECLVSNGIPNYQGLEYSYASGYAVKHAYMRACNAHLIQPAYHGHCTIVRQNLTNQRLLPAYHYPPYPHKLRIRLVHNHMGHSYLRSG